MYNVKNKKMKKQTSIQPQELNVNSDSMNKTLKSNEAISMEIFKGDNYPNNENAIEVDIDLVKPHPIAAKTYQKKDLTNLKFIMTFFGLFYPIKVIKSGSNYFVYDGISRLIAAHELGWKSIRIEITDLTESEIQDHYIIGNYHTKRTYSELCKQAEVILGILGSSQGKRRERIGDLSLGDENFGKVGKDRFQLACVILDAPFSASTLRRLLEVKEFEDNSTEETKDFKLLEKIEKGDMKVNQALNIINAYKRTKEEYGKNELTETLSAMNGKKFHLFNKSCEDLNDIPDESVQSTIYSGPYFQKKIYPDGVMNTEEPQHGMEQTVDEYVRKEVEICKGVYKKLKRNGNLFINTADSYDNGIDCLVVEKLCIELEKSGWRLVQKWFWSKENPKPQADFVKRLLPSYEYILWFCKDPDEYYFREFKNWKEEEKYEVSRGSTDAGFGKKLKEGRHTWTLKKPLERFKSFLSEQHVKQIIHANGFTWGELKEIDPNFRHLAPFPFYIPLLPILMTTKVGDTVLDIFNGTSTTTAVALQLGRNAIGYDTDTASHEFAGKRLYMVEENLPSTNEIIDFENEFMIERNKSKYSSGEAA